MKQFVCIVDRNKEITIPNGNFKLQVGDVISLILPVEESNSFFKKMKIKRHRKVAFESSNPKVATVTSSGKIKAKSKGTCYVYAYAQNGVFKKIKVVVK